MFSFSPHFAWCLKKSYGWRPKPHHWQTKQKNFCHQTFKTISIIAACGVARWYPLEKEPAPPSDAACCHHKTPFALSCLFYHKAPSNWSEFFWCVSRGKGGVPFPWMGCLSVVLHQHLSFPALQKDAEEILIRNFDLIKEQQAWTKIHLAGIMNLLTSAVKRTLDGSNTPELMLTYQMKAGSNVLLLG